MPPTRCHSAAQVGGEVGRWSGGQTRARSGHSRPLPEAIYEIYLTPTCRLSLEWPTSTGHSDSGCTRRTNHGTRALAPPTSATSHSVILGHYPAVYEICPRPTWRNCTRPHHSTSDGPLDVLGHSFSPHSRPRATRSRPLGELYMKYTSRQPGENEVGVAGFELRGGGFVSIRHRGGDACVELHPKSRLVLAILGD